MESPSKFKYVAAAFFVIIAVNIFVIVSNSSDLKRVETKTEHLAKELDKMKMDVRDISSRKDTSSSVAAISPQDSSMMANLLSRLSTMKTEIDALKKKSGDSPALAEHREKEERLWRDHAEKVKEAWTANLLQNLSAAGFSDVERDMVADDYSVILDKMRDEQISWYKGDISSEELNDASRRLSREFYDNMSYTVGEQKSSVVMSILFPDPVVRKELLSK